jgi:hypothetical protein
VGLVLGRLGLRYRRSPVDHTVYDTTSILAFIEKRFGLHLLTGRVAPASPLLGAFNFNAAG